MYTHVLNDTKHNEIDIIPYLLITLKVKIKYGCYNKAHIITDIRM